MLLDGLPGAPPDPVLGLAAAFERDPAPFKVDLGIGVYRDEEGRSAVLSSVKRAEQWLLENQSTKSYLSSAGEPRFNEAAQTLLFGATSGPVADGRVRTIQTPGGSGALRVGAEFIRRCGADTTVWVPTPTWANHLPIMRAAGLKAREYTYYDPTTHIVAYSRMLEELEALAPADVLLVHGCCHNPSGADLDAGQWRGVAELLARKGAVPFVDLAYQGFAQDIEADAASLRMLTAELPVVLVASSCSKNFSLYRERTGSLSIVAERADDAERAQANMLQIIRAIYSMPPDHGAAVVAHILRTPDLRDLWDEELSAMRMRIMAMRGRLADRLERAGLGQLNYLRAQHGMFSFLDVSHGEVAQLRDEFHVHLIESGRINVAGLTTTNVARVADAIASVMRARPA
jgi:aspartate aminotransferase